MAKSRTRTQPKKTQLLIPVMVRLDEESKAFLTHAAKLRRISVSAYVREVAVTQARKEVLAAQAQGISLTPEEQIAFWKALNDPSPLTEAQRHLGELMRGES